MQEVTTSNHSSKFFRLYVGIMLTIATIFLGLILAVLIYGGYKLNNESKVISQKVNSFDSQVQNINTNLKSINQQLQLGHTILP